jgi:hypothetical protein
VRVLRLEIDYDRDSGKVVGFEVIAEGSPRMDQITFPFEDPRPHVEWSGVPVPEFMDRLDQLRKDSQTMCERAVKSWIPPYE